MSNVIFLLPSSGTNSALDAGFFDAIGVGSVEEHADIFFFPFLSFFFERVRAFFPSCARQSSFPLGSRAKTTEYVRRARFICHPS
jgi:hypothetical protein